MQSSSKGFLQVGTAEMLGNFVNSILSDHARFKKDFILLIKGHY